MPKLKTTDGPLIDVLQGKTLHPAFLLDDGTASNIEDGESHVLVKWVVTGEQALVPEKDVRKPESKRSRRKIVPLAPMVSHGEAKAATSHLRRDVEVGVCQDEKARREASKANPKRAADPSEESKPPKRKKGRPKGSTKHSVERKEPKKQKKRLRPKKENQSDADNDSADGDNMHEDGSSPARGKHVHSARNGRSPRQQLDSHVPAEDANQEDSHQAESSEYDSDGDESLGEPLPQDFFRAIDSLIASADLTKITLGGMIQRVAEDCGLSEPGQYKNKIRKRIVYLAEKP